MEWKERKEGTLSCLVGSPNPTQPIQHGEGRHHPSALSCHSYILYFIYTHEECTNRTECRTQYY